jgi:WD40 repeat protein
MPLLTIVFTDVVESSATKRDLSLGRDSRERDRAYLETVQTPYYNMVRECYRARGGHEVSTMGDAFYLTFGDPFEAIRCAADIQRRLAEYPIDTPRGPLCLRIGIHSGYPVFFEGGYQGADVDLAARVEAMATAGQILLSSATYELVRSMTDVKFHRLGEFGLKGVDQEVLWEADWDGKGPRATTVAPLRPPLSALLRSVSQTAERPREPFMVEDLPGNFVARPKEFGTLISLLLNADRGEPVAMTAALRGAGGFGKTTLARALCHDERIQEAFDDGILWVTLGENPGALKSKVLDFVEVLSGVRPGFDVEAASTRLAELLTGRDILMVIDDVWDAAHLAPFLRDPKETKDRRCARLITTRNQDTLPPKARTVDVDAMRASEAVQLLAAGLPSAYTAELEALAGRLGKWPVLLNLVNGVLRDRVTAKDRLADALEFVNADLDENGLATFDKPFDAAEPKQRDRAVAATLGVSLKRLEEAERARYRELAIFPEDVDIPLSTLELLWSATGSLSKLKTQKLCERLGHLSLLQRVDLATRTIGLHDVMRAYLVRELGKQAEPRNLHASLLDAWGDAYNLPDSYAWRWCAWHLREAGREKELRKLLLDFNWLQAKLNATDVSALISDYDRVAEPAGSRGTTERELPGEPIAIPPWRCAAAKLPPSSLSRAEEGREHATLPQGELRAQDDLPLVQEALRLSAHVLARDRTQLAGQLLGRLCAEYSAGCHVLVEAARGWKGAPWLRPLLSSLTPPGGPLVRTLAGHSGRVWGVAVTPDGKQAASVSMDGTLKVWDLGSGREVRTLAGHSGEVNGVAVTPDGKQAVSASGDGTLKVWDLGNGREVRTLAGHSSGVRGVAVTPDGKQAVSASQDGTLKVWNLGSGREVRTLAGHRGWINGVVVTPDGKQAVSASDDQTLKVWDLGSGREVPMLLGHTGGIRGVAVTPDGRQAVSASDDQTLKVWHLGSGRGVRTPTRHSSAVRGVAVTPDGKQAVSASHDQTLKVWNLGNGREVQTLAGHSDGVWGVAVTPDGKQAVSASLDGTLKVWDLGSGREVRTLTGHSDGVYGVAVTPDGKQAVSASQDGTLKVWDLGNGREVRTLAGHSSGVRGVAVTPDGKQAVSASQDGTVKVWDVGSGQEVAVFTADAGIGACALVPHGATIVAGDDSGRIHFLQLEGV